MQNWFANNQGDMGAVLSAGTYFSNTIRWSLRVAVNVIPEPGSATLVAAAAAGLAMRRRRQ
jgi:hypothetical protein